TEQPRDAHLASIDVDANFRELRTIGMHGKSLRFRIVSGLTGHFESFSGNDSVFFLETLAQLASSFDDGRSPRGRSHRATGDHCSWQQGIANFEMDALHWNGECIRGDLREDSPGPCSNI